MCASARVRKRTRNSTPIFMLRIVYLYARRCWFGKWAHIFVYKSICLRLRRVFFIYSSKEEKLGFFDRILNFEPSVYAHFVSRTRFRDPYLISEVSFISSNFLKFHEKNIQNPQKIPTFHPCIAIKTLAAKPILVCFWCLFSIFFQPRLKFRAKKKSFL